MAEQITPIIRGWLRSLASFVGIILLATVTKTAIAEPFYIPSGSMEPTLLVGDALLASKFPYGFSTASLPSTLTLPASDRIFAAQPARGDIVVFRWPGDRQQTWIKRVIGLPHDRVQMRNGRLWINGSPVALRPDGTGEAEDASGATVIAQRFIETLPDGKAHAIFKLDGANPFDNTDEILVPPGHVFVLGDNRDNSADSRVPVRQGGVGLLPIRDLVGRADALIGSWDLAARQRPIWTWPAGLRLARFFTIVR